MGNSVFDIKNFIDCSTSTSNPAPKLQKIIQSTTGWAWRKGEDPLKKMQNDANKAM